MRSLCCNVASWSHRFAAGKFPTPVSNNEDLNNKLNEVRCTIKFQLKKVLCLGVAVGHVEMNDDQVLANVMLSADNSIFPALPYLNYPRHQLPRLPAQEELAEHQVSPHQIHHGFPHPPLLNVYSRRICHCVLQNIKPRTLRPTVSVRRELSGS